MRQDPPSFLSSLSQRYTKLWDKYTLFCCCFLSDPCPVILYFVPCCRGRWERSNRCFLLAGPSIAQNGRLAVIQLSGQERSRERGDCKRGRQTTPVFAYLRIYDLRICCTVTKQTRWKPWNTSTAEREETERGDGKRRSKRRKEGPLRNVT